MPAAEVKEVLEARVLSQVLTGRFILPLMRQDAASCYLITTGRLGACMRARRGGERACWRAAEWARVRHRPSGGAGRPSEPCERRGPALDRAGESCPAPEWAVYTMANAATYGVVSALRAESGVRVQEVSVPSACWAALMAPPPKPMRMHYRVCVEEMDVSFLPLGGRHGRGGTRAWGAGKPHQT